MLFTRHFMKLVVFTLLLAVLNGILISFTSLRDVALSSWISLALFSVLTTISLKYIIGAFKKKNATEKNISMYINTFMKLAVSLIAFLVLIKIFPDHKKLVAIPFMLYYFCYTAFEMFLIKNLKRPVVK